MAVPVADTADAQVPPRKCRWCDRAFPRTFKGAADLWRHARQEHDKEFREASFRKRA